MSLHPRYVIKRDNSVVPFDIERIRRSINKAAVAAITGTNEVSPQQASTIIYPDLDKISKAVTRSLVGVERVSVEDIQDAIEKQLVKAGEYAISKEYIIFREHRRVLREAKAFSLDALETTDSYLDESDWRSKENSNVTYSIGGLILHQAGAVASRYWLEKVLPKRVADAHRNADFHLHDLGVLSPYCCGHSLKQLLNTGLRGVEGKISSGPAQHLNTAMQHVVNYLGVLQNEWAGAQALNGFDTFLAPFIKKDKMTKEEVMQCMQTLLYGINTPSRWGCVDKDTEVMTLKGFKRYDQLKTGDKIFTMNLSTGALEINDVQSVTIKKNDTGKLQRYRGDHYEQLITRTHRTLVTEEEYKPFIRTSEEIYADEKLPTFPALFCSSSVKNADPLIGIEGIGAFLGSVFLWGEKWGEDVILPMPHPSIREDVFQAAQRLGGRGFRKIGLFNKRVVISFPHREGLHDLLNSLVNGQVPTMSSIVASDFISVAFLKVVTEGGPARFNDLTKVESFQLACVMAGWTTHIEVEAGAYLVYLNPPTIEATSKEEVEYDDIVWCPTVENGTAVFRKNGNVFISGQTQAPFSNITIDWMVPKDLADKKVELCGGVLDFTYGECQDEMDLINQCLMESYLAGDYEGRGFQYPILTISIDTDFQWEHKNCELAFGMAAKYGSPYFQNFIGSDMSASDVRSMCCRLRLDLRELRQKGGGLFGAYDSTGSVSVTTLNLPRIGYLANNEAEFFERLDALMDLARDASEVRRKFLNKGLRDGLYPYTKVYLGTLDNHFSTIGLVGMHECCLNFLGKGIDTVEGLAFSERVLDHMRERLSQYQVETGNLYNLEATPAESTCYRLALHDKKRYPDIITAGKPGNAPYYTNSSNLPVGYTSDLFEAINHQEKLQTRYTGGVVFHTFLDQGVDDWRVIRDLIKKMCYTSKLPYFTISPIYSICRVHGYLKGRQTTCPKCRDEQIAMYRKKLTELEKEEEAAENQQ